MKRHVCETMGPKDEPDFFPPNEDGEIVCTYCWEVVSDEA